jgi:Short C-terminal domain/Phospholipase_D-nuclease N-terminal
VEVWSHHPDRRLVRWRGLADWSITGGKAMVLAATDYPFLNIFWTILIFFAWLVWLWIAVTVLIDVFRRHDLSGWIKAAWTIFVIVLPFLGVLTYLIFNHTGMAERSNKEAAATQAQFDDYVRRAAGTSGAASEIEKAKQLLDKGTITQSEFDAIKAKALAST